MSKFELTNETTTLNGVVLHRISALRDIDSVEVKAGDLGGFVESEANLSHEGDAWIAGDAKVYGKAVVSGNGYVSEKAKVYGSAVVTDEACLFDSAKVFGNAVIQDDARIEDTVSVSGRSKVGGKVSISGKVKVSGKSTISGAYPVYGNVKLKDANLSNPFHFKLMGDYGGEEHNYSFKFNLYRTVSGPYNVFCDTFSGNVADFMKFVDEEFGVNRFGRRIKKDTLSATEA